jgi:DNA-directed RNA polymerase specialized sigma24 family protein
METHDPLSLTDAEIFWESISRKLYPRTVYQILHAPLPNEEARSGLIQDGAFIENIIDRLKHQFFEAVKREKVWGDAVEHWFARTHRRTTRKMAKREARRYFPRTRPHRNDGDGGDFDIPSASDLPEALAQKREILERIARHVSRLPQTKARLFQDLVDGIGAEEISARDGIKAGTVRKRMHDLRQELRELVAEQRGKTCRQRRKVAA